MDVSVIIPAYNAAATLPDTLASLRGQTLAAGWEVIVVEDGSEDETEAVLSAAAASFPVPFRVLSGSHGGVGAARNRGLSTAEGTYLLYLDADDLLLPRALEILLREAQRRDADILLFDSEFLYSDGTTKPYPASSCAAGEMTPRDYLYAQPAPWNKLIRRKLFVDNPLRFPEGILFEDLALMPALAGFAQRIWYHQEILHQYRQTETSITRGAWSRRRLDILPALDRLIRSIPQMREDVEALAFRHLYGTFVWQAWAAGDREAIREINRFMNERFHDWPKDRIIREEPWKRRITASLFHRERFGLIRLWKGGGK